MKKFIITEEDKKHIMDLYEVNVNNLPALEPNRLTSPKSQQTKKEQEFLNKKYPEFKIPVDGNWLDKSFNDAMVKYITEKGGTPIYCKKVDDYCGEGQEGVVYTSDSKIRYELQQEMKGGETPQNESWLTYPGDKNYQYQKQGDKWMGKNVKTGKVIDLAKYPTTIQKLDKQFPGGK
jgi:hypothetical protein